jgi:hypothetical protein
MLLFSPNPYQSKILTSRLIAQNNTGPSIAEACVDGADLAQRLLQRRD